MMARGASAVRVSAMAALLAASIGCGGEVPHGGVPNAPPSQPSADAPEAGHLWDAVEVIPSDLDLVLRVDLARVRASLGAEPMKQLASHALGAEADDPLLSGALAEADIVWVGVRVADALAGDRVVVVEAPRATIELDPNRWRKGEPPAAGIESYDAIDFVPRDSTARVLDIGGRAMAFVSPVQLDSVDRLLRRGPDAMAGEPVARGLVSLDWRVRRPGASLENRYPSFAALLSGVQRVTAVVEPRGRELDLDGRLLCHNERAADRAARFLHTIQQGAAQTERFAGLLDGLKIEASSSTVRVRWHMPAALVLGLLSGGAVAPSPPDGPSVVAP